MESVIRLLGNMKNIIQSIGDKFIAIALILFYIGSIIAGFGAMSGYGGSFFIGIGTMIGGLLSTTMIFYGIYIMIDIRDSLREIKDKK